MAGAIEFILITITLAAVVAGTFSSPSKTINLVIVTLVVLA